MDRGAQGHLCFGFGTHFCLGAALARLEARVATQVFLSRLSRIELLEEEVERTPSMILRGPRRLHVAFEAARAPHLARATAPAVQQP